MQESQERSNKLILKKRTQLMNRDIDSWLTKYDVRNDMKTVIMENIHKLEGNNDLDMKNVLSILPIKDKKIIMLSLFSASLEKKRLENVSDSSSFIIFIKSNCICWKPGSQSSTSIGGIVLDNI